VFIVSGRLRQCSYEIREGEERTVSEVVAGGPMHQRDGLPGVRWHHEAILPCHQQEQQTVTAAWAGWKRRCPIGNSGPVVHWPKTIMPMVAPWLLGCLGTAR